MSTEYSTTEAAHIIYLTYMEVALNSMIGDVKENSEQWYLIKSLQKHVKKLDATYSSDPLPKEFTVKAEEFYKLVDKGVRDLLLAGKYITELEELCRD